MGTSPWKGCFRQRQNCRKEAAQFGSGTRIPANPEPSGGLSNETGLNFNSSSSPPEVASSPHYKLPQGLPSDLRTQAGQCRRGKAKRTKDVIPWSHGLAIVRLAYVLGVPEPYVL
ncbi:hypothetical protein UY3_15920 [Chelonia mydas]|uniref:Uncharacterized protein n=1 Tax=Chelonia mydas TaxID=8469 RepID=M7AP17_CHEMY|nr:hypothetical protein UY3_15920 [Chelonia mydas]